MSEDMTLTQRKKNQRWGQIFMPKVLHHSLIDNKKTLVRKASIQRKREKIKMSLKSDFSKHLIHGKIIMLYYWVKMEDTKNLNMHIHIYLVYVCIHL